MTHHRRNLGRTLAACCAVAVGDRRSASASQVQELNRVSLSTQPLASFEWSRDKLGLFVTTAFDQTMRVAICTKLNLLWRPGRRETTEPVGPSAARSHETKRVAQQ